MSEPGIVIIGAGQAGARAALTLREADAALPITLIGEEVWTPYQRPPLSKAVLTGVATPETCTIAGTEALARDRIHLHAGSRVARIDRAAKVAVLEDGGSVPYRRLLLAAGARARRLAVPGAELEGIHTLRTMGDAEALAGRLRPGARIVVIGGGFIGLEVAASAVARGCSVTVVELGPRLLMRAVPEEIAALIAGRHREAGVAIRCGASLAGFEGEGRVSAARLGSGEAIPCDAALIGVGAEPNVELAEAAGLAVDDGIRVDTHLATDDPDIFAAGDCCSFPHPLYGGRRIRLECWRNAESQGAHAAGSLLGAAEPYGEVPWFWSDQYDAVLQIAGLPTEGRTTVARGEGGEAGLFFHLDAGSRIVGASGFGPLGAVAKPIRIAQMLIERQARPDPAVLAAPHRPLKSLLRGA